MKTILSCNNFKVSAAGMIFVLAVSGIISSCAPTRQPASDNSLAHAGALDSSSEIIGGTPVQKDAVISKSIVAIYDAAKRTMCTGSLIAENVVLSAAHCVGKNPKSMIIIFSVNTDEVMDSVTSLADLFKDPRVRQVESAVVSSVWIARQRALTARMIANPGQPLTLTEAETKNTGDISVIKFSGKAPAEYVPAKFLTDSSLLKNGATVTLAGYGYTDGAKRTGTGELREVQVQIHNAEFSQSEVTLDQTHAAGACHGDSGGPAYISVNGQQLLWGITSRGIDDKNDDCSTYSAYTNALAYLPTIEKSVRALTQGGR